MILSSIRTFIFPSWENALPLITALFPSHATPPAPLHRPCCCQWCYPWHGKPKSFPSSTGAATMRQPNRRPYPYCHRDAAHEIVEPTSFSLLLPTAMSCPWGPASLFRRTYRESRRNFSLSSLKRGKRPESSRTHHHKLGSFNNWVVLLVLCEHLKWEKVSSFSLALQKDPICFCCFSGPMEIPMGAWDSSRCKKNGAFDAWAAPLSLEPLPQSEPPLHV